ncbi:hypothetical protein PR048_033722 [Dryococelus australis]|uniref:DDE Tnp4 domain-containing protein n=1 Tax=Dryococelus australis TaxID=614101 RepID=A0ABQ9G138_9NEOP|nr:hypothetical protein PR048_033722 [Dryococelus australis]
MLPLVSGSYIYNYKNFHSQVLLAIAYANYELLYFSFGTNGRVSDRGVFDASDLSKKLEDGSLNLPKEGTVAGKKYAPKVATPARKIFNYRLSRVR